MKGFGLLIVAAAASCAGDDDVTTSLVTADVVATAEVATAEVSTAEVSTAEVSTAEVSTAEVAGGDDGHGDDDVDTSIDVADDDVQVEPEDVPSVDAPDADFTDLPDTSLLDVPDADPAPPDTTDTSDPLDAEDLLDVEEPDILESDIVPDPDDTLDLTDVVAPVTPLVVGTFAGAAFTPLPDNVDLEITQGPQGGIHLEVGIDVVWDSMETKLAGVLSCRTRLGATDVGFNETPNFILYRAPQGTYRSVMIPIYFQDWDAAVYVDKNVAVSCAFTVGDVVLEDGAVVHLVDLF